MNKPSESAARKNKLNSIYLRYLKIRPIAWFCGVLLCIFGLWMVLLPTAYLMAPSHYVKKQLIVVKTERVHKPRGAGRSVMINYVVADLDGSQFEIPFSSFKDAKQLSSGDTHCMMCDLNHPLYGHTPQIDFRFIDCELARVSYWRVPITLFAFCSPLMVLTAFVRKIRNDLESVQSKVET